MATASAAGGRAKRLRNPSRRKRAHSGEASLKYADRDLESAALFAFVAAEGEERTRLLDIAPPDAFFHAITRKAAAVLKAMHTDNELFTKSALAQRLNAPDSEIIASRITAGLRVDDGAVIDTSLPRLRVAQEVARQWRARERVGLAEDYAQACRDGETRVSAQILERLSQVDDVRDPDRKRPFFGSDVFLDCDEEEENPWGLAEGLIPREGRMLVVAPSGAGKTMLSIELALCAALPEWKLFDTFDKPIDGALRVLVFSLEDRRASVRSRMKALLQGRGITKPLLTPVQEAALGNIRVEYPGSVVGLSLSDPASFAAIERAIREHDADLVIYDNATKLCGGANENQVGEMQAALFGPIDRLYGRYGGLHVVMHHTGHDKRGGASAARGTSAFEGWADIRWAWVGGRVEMKHREDSATWPALRDPIPLRLVNDAARDGAVRWAGPTTDQDADLGKGALRFLNDLVDRGSATSDALRELASNGSARKRYLEVLENKGYVYEDDEGSVRPTEKGVNRVRPGATP